MYTLLIYCMCDLIYYYHYHYILVNIALLHILPLNILVINATVIFGNNTTLMVYVYTAREEVDRC